MMGQQNMSRVAYMRWYGVVLTIATVCFCGVWLTEGGNSAGALLASSCILYFVAGQLIESAGRLDQDADGG